VAYMIAAGISVVAVSLIPHGTNNTGIREGLSFGHDFYVDRPPSPYPPPVTPLLLRYLCNTKKRAEKYQEQTVKTFERRHLGH